MFSGIHSLLSRQKNGSTPLQPLHRQKSRGIEIGLHGKISCAYGNKSLESAWTSVRTFVWVVPFKPALGNCEHMKWKAAKDIASVSSQA